MKQKKKQSADQDSEQYLRLMLQKLDEATVRARETQGYNEETAYLNLLTELVREQIPDENSHPSASTSR